MSDAAIPMADLAGETARLWPELAPEIERLLKSGQFIMGPEVAAFEREFGDYLGGGSPPAGRPIAVGSGTDALVIALRALGIGADDEVITTPFSFVATASCILRVGATPVFCDIDPRTMNLDMREVADAIGPRTRAIIPVHLYGQACDMQALSQLAAAAKLLVVEDAAQALSATYRDRKLGTFGDASAFSFFPSKNLGAYGDAGLLTVKDPEVAECAAMLRVHGARRKYHNEVVGYNSRLDALQAAILRVKLRHLDAGTAKRRAAAAGYDVLLASVSDVTAPYVDPPVGHAFHQYTVRVPAGRRDRVQETMHAAGIATMVYYPVLLSHLPPFADHARTRARPLPQAERACSEVLSLPIWPDISPAQQERVVDTLARALAVG